MSRSEFCVAYLERLKTVRSQIAARCTSHDLADRAEVLLKRLEQYIVRPVRIVLLGEVNGGKTTLANRLLGCQILATDVIHNTRASVLLKYAPSSYVDISRSSGDRVRVDQINPGNVRLNGDDILEVGLPIELLREVEVLDTPGVTLHSSSIARARTACALGDIVIWCTVVTQAWRGSEIAFWNSLGVRKRRFDHIAVTHADLVSATDRDRVRARVMRDAGPRFRSVFFSGSTDGMDGEAFPESIRTEIRSIFSDRCRRSSAVIAQFTQKLDRAVVCDLEAARAIAP